MNEQERQQRMKECRERAERIRQMREEAQRLAALGRRIEAFDLFNAVGRIETMMSWSV